MIEREFLVVNKRGLHARAAAKFVHAASRFESHVIVTHEGEEADGKSILSLMVLGAAMGAKILIRTEGPDEAAALEGLGALLASRFDEHD